MIQQLSQLPHLHILLANEGGNYDVDIASFNVTAAAAAYEEIVKGCGKPLTEDEVLGLEPDDWVEIAGQKYRAIDDYGDQLSTTHEVELKGLPPFAFGDYFQWVMSKLMETHNWDDPYDAISPSYDDGAGIISAILSGYLRGTPYVELAAQIDKARYGDKEDE